MKYSKPKAVIGDVVIIKTYGREIYFQGLICSASYKAWILLKIMAIKKSCKIMQNEFENAKNDMSNLND